MLEEEKKLLILNKLSVLTDIAKTLEYSFPEYKYIKYMELIKDNIEFGKISLDSLLSKIESFQVNNTMYYTEINYHLFSIITMQNHFEHYLYESSKKIFSDGNLYQTIDKIIDVWKHMPEIILISSLRNRIQHAGTININIDVTYNYQINKWIREIQISKEIWNSVCKCLKADKKKVVLPYLDRNIYSNNNSINILLDDYVLKNKILCENLHSSIIERFSNKYNNRQDAINNFKKVYQELEELGVSPGIKLNE